MDLGSQVNQQPKEEFNSNAESNTSYANNKPKSNTITIALIIVIIILVIVILVYLFLSLEKPKTPNNINSSTKSVTKNSTSPTTANNPYSGWITYTNSTFDYSFKHSKRISSLGGELYPLPIIFSFLTMIAPDIDLKQLDFIAIFLALFI